MGVSEAVEKLESDDIAGTEADWTASTLNWRNLTLLGIRPYSAAGTVKSKPNYGETIEIGETIQLGEMTKTLASALTTKAIR
jgi:hypothetical protein